MKLSFGRTIFLVSHDKSVKNWGSFDPNLNLNQRTLVLENSCEIGNCACIDGFIEKGDFIWKCVLDKLFLFSYFQ